MPERTATRMSDVLCLLGEGFEEIEAVTPVDILRRAGVGVVLAAAGGSLTVVGRSGISMMAGRFADTLDANDFDALILPGGPGVAGLRRTGLAARLAADFHASGKIVAAICAAPLILLDAGLLEGVALTCHASAAGELPWADIGQRVVVSGNIVTSRGAGTSLDFALALVRVLVGPEKEAEVAASIMA